jgi:hypothetical protein
MCDVGYFGDDLVGDELEGDSDEDKHDGELQTILNFTPVHSEGGERQRADDALKNRTTQS